jgi:hypothetical protein
MIGSQGGSGRAYSNEHQLLACNISLGPEWLRNIMRILLVGAEPIMPPIAPTVEACALGRHRLNKPRPAARRVLGDLNQSCKIVAQISEPLHLDVMFADDLSHLSARQPFMPLASLTLAKKSFRPFWFFPKPLLGFLSLQTVK